MVVNLFKALSASPWVPVYLFLTPYLCPPDITNCPLHLLITLFILLLEYLPHCTIANNVLPPQAGFAWRILMTGAFVWGNYHVIINRWSRHLHFAIVLLPTVLPPALWQDLRFNTYKNYSFFDSIDYACSFSNPPCSLLQCHKTAQ